jgi:microcystin-dependent protein
MAQVLRPESIGTITKVSNTTLTIGPSVAIIGGQQRTTTSNITITTSTSGANGIDTGVIAANQFYYAYLVISNGVIGGVISLSSSSPTGFPAYKLVGQCTTDGSSNLVAANKTMEDNSPIGHVMPAMLSESQFRAIHGSGWVLAAGQSVAGSKYATLTGLTFAPDLRGRTIAGVDNMGGSAANRLTPGGSGITGNIVGTAGGAETHTLSQTQMPSHTHTVNTPTIRIGNNFGVGAFIAGTTTDSGNNAVSGGVNTPTNQNTGGGGAHNNTQPTMVMNMFIKIN